MPRYDDEPDAWSSASTAGGDYRRGVDYRSGQAYTKGDYRRTPSIGNVTDASVGSDGGSLWTLFSDMPRLKAGICVCIVNSTTCCGQSCMMAPFAELLLQRACERSCA